MDRTKESLCLARCASTHMDETDQSLVRRLCGEGLDWEWVAGRAIQNRVGPLLYRNLREMGIAASVPAEMRRDLEKSYQLSLSRTTRFERAVGDMLARLGQKDIRAILLRGLALGETVYGDPVLRPFTDMDLLIRKQDLANVCQILLDLGYGPVPGALDDNYYEAVHLHIQYANKENGALAEVHWALDHKYTVFNIDYDQIFEEAAAGELAGVGALLMSPENLLLSLCVHLIKHCYYAGCLLDQPDFTSRVLGTGLLIQYCDISEVIRYYGVGLDWDLVLQKARNWQVEPAVQPVLASVVRLFDAPVPGTILQSLPVPKAGWLRRRILASAVKDGPDGEAGATPMSPLGRLAGLSTALMFRPVRLLDLLGYLWPPRRFIAARYGAENPTMVSIYHGWHVGKTIGDLLWDLVSLVYYAKIKRRR